MKTTISSRTLFSCFGTTAQIKIVTLPVLAGQICIAMSRACITRSCVIFVHGIRKSSLMSMSSLQSANFASTRNLVTTILVPSIKADLRVIPSAASVDNVSTATMSYIHIAGTNMRDATSATDEIMDGSNSTLSTTTHWPNTFEKITLFV